MFWKSFCISRRQRAIMRGLMGTRTDHPRARWVWLGRTVAFAVVVSAIASLLFMGAWMYVLVRGPVERSWREGPMVVTWVADEMGITRRVVLEPATGIPMLRGLGLSRATWTVRKEEGFWFRRGDEIDRRFVPSIATLRDVDIEQLKA